MMQKVYTKIESIVGNVVTVRASGVRNGDLALVGDSYANVIKLDKDLVTLQVFSGTQGVSTTDPVRFLGRPMMVSFSDHLLGRIFDGAGVPRDNGPALTENMIPIGGPSVNPAKRIVPNKMIRTGIPMIDVFNTLVESRDRAGRHGTEIRRLSVLPGHAGKERRHGPHGDVHSHRL